MATFDAGSIRADVELDATPFKRRLADMKREGERFAQNRFSPKLDADDSEAKRKINAIKLQLASLAGTTRVNVDVGGGVNEQLDAIQARREALNAQSITMTVNLNRYGVVMNQLRMMTQAVSRLDGRTIDIDVQADTTAARARLAVLRREMTAMSRMRITPQVNPQGGAGGAAASAAAGGASSMLNMAAAGAAAASALSPLVTVTAGVAAGLVSMAAAGGGAAAVFGGVLMGAVKQYSTAAKEIDKANKNLDQQKEVLKGLTPGTEAYATQLKKVEEAQKQVKEAQAKMTPEMKTFDRAINGVTGAWSSMIEKTSPQTFGVMTPVLQGVTAMINRMAPVVRAIAPIFQEVGDSFKRWAEGAGGTRFMNFIRTNGVPILYSMVSAGKSVILTAGNMIKAFAPMGRGIAASLAGAAGSMKEWSDNGGFVRFLAKVREMAPMAKEFFKALGGAVVNLAKAMAALGPVSLLTATGMLKLIAALPPPVLSAIIALFIAWRTALVAHRIATQAATLGITRQRLATIANRIATMAATLAMRTARLVILAGAAAQRIFTGAINSGTLATVRARLASVANRIATVAMTVVMRGARLAILGAAAAQRILSIAFLSSPIGWLVLALAGLVVAFVLLWKRCAWFRNFWVGLWNGIKSVARSVWNWLKENWRTAVVVMLGIITGPFGAGIAYMITHWRQVQRVFGAVWRFIRDNVFAPIGRYFTQTIPRWARTMRNGVTSAWQGMSNSITRLYRWIRDNIFAPIGRFFTQTIPRWGQTLWRAMSATWKRIQDVIFAPYRWIRDHVFEPLGRFFTKTIPGWANKLKDKVEDAWNGVKRITRNVWNSIGGLLENAINGAIGLVNKLIGGFNNITGFLKIKVKIDKIPKVDFKKFAVGGMVPGGPQHFAGGGFIPGYAPGVDSVPAMLSPGEGVLTPEAVRGLGGEQFVHGANRQFAGHRGAGRDADGHIGGSSFGFARGGMAPMQFFGVGGMVRAGLARAGVGIGSVTQGEYSNGSLSAGTHTGGGVVDIAAGPNSGGVVARLRRAGFAAWLRTPSEGFAYHIHAVQMNNPNLSGAARAQVRSYLNGGNGLANGGKDTFGGGGAADFDIMGLLKKSAGKILANVYKGGKALSGIGGQLASMLGGGGGGLFGTGIGPDVGPNVAGAFMKQFGVGGDVGQMVLSVISKASAGEGLASAKKGFGDFNKGGGIANIVKALGNSTSKGLVGKLMPDFLVGKKKDSTFKLSDLFGNMGVGGGGSGTKRWATLAAMAMRITGMNGPGKLKDFLGLMAKESGGNPRAINKTDINARNGIASRGLMQVIPPTFRAYHEPGTSWNIYDPLANMAASLNYIKARYGGRIPGSPYYTGVIGATPGMHAVGEHAAELVTQPGMKLFKGGERVYNGRETGNILGGAGGGTQVIDRTVIVRIDGHSFTGIVEGIVDDTMGAADRSR